MAFSLVSVFVILILVNILTPSVKELLRNTPVYDGINKNIETYVDKQVQDVAKDMTQTGVNAQKKIIESLPLPNGIIKNLTENNNQKSYDSLKVKSFSEYIAAMLSDMVLSALTFVILFVVITVLIKILLHILNIVTKLPVIHMFNTVGGGIIGFAEGILIIWIACIVVTLFSATSWGQEICKAIAQNEMLSFIYDNNLIQQLIMGIFSF